MCAKTRNIEEMLAFTKAICRATSDANQYQVRERNNYIISKIAGKFKISSEDAEFVFDNNSDFEKVYNYFN